MTRKSAASFKAVKGKQDELMPLEDVFKIMREGYLITIETNIATAKRVDNLFNIRDVARKFWNDDATRCTPKYYKKLHKLSVETYEKIYEIAKEKYTIEELSNTEMGDWYEELIPTVDSLSDTDQQDIIEAMIIFLSVKPYGEKMLRDHLNFQEELEKREANNGSL